MNRIGYQITTDEMNKIGMQQYNIELPGTMPHG